MGANQRNMREEDLYEPVEKHFSKLGYIVHGEVNDCDVVAVKDQELLIVELKLTLNIELLMQSTKRQRLAEFVYIAIPEQTKRIRRSKWRDICYLLRRLELGFLMVTNDGEIKVIHEPGPFDRKRSMQQSQRRKERLLQEVEGRRISTNVGGSHQKKIRTAYKESSIHIACLLAHLGPLSAKSLQNLGTCDKTYSILYNNYYGWFERVERGIYELTEKGLASYKMDREIYDYYTEKIKEVALDVD